MCRNAGQRSTFVICFLTHKFMQLAKPDQVALSSHAVPMGAVHCCEIELSGGQLEAQVTQARNLLRLRIARWIVDRQLEAVAFKGRVEILMDVVNAKLVGCLVGCALMGQEQPFDNAVERVESPLALGVLALNHAQRIGAPAVALFSYLHQV